MQIKHLAIAIMAAGVAGQTAAAGFALSEQSVSAGGTANAGRTSNVQDASVVFNNPAAMHKLKQAQFTQALAFIDAQTKISNVTAPFGGTNDGDMVPHTFVPSGYFTSGDKGGWAWGVAAYGSFGLKTNYESSFAGNHLGDKSKVQVITIQPALSYRVNDKVSVGFGPTINRLDTYLSKDTSGFSPLGNVELEGDDMGYGFNAGVHVEIDAATQAGVVYRSSVKYKIDDGTLTSSTVGQSKASTGITLPESVELSISHKLDAKNTLHAGATWTRWSRLQTLPVTSATLGALPAEEFHWKDSTGYAIGLTHAYSDKLDLRAGIAYDNSPVNPEFRSVRLPSGDRRIASLGAGYKLTPTQTIDVSYTYLDEEKAEVRQAASAYSADFHNKASIYGLQFTQKF